MENRNAMQFERDTLASLDIVLAIIAKRLISSFDPENPDSIKLLREFRSTLQCRRTWAKEYGLLEDNNKEKQHPADGKKEDKKPATPIPSMNKPPMLKEKNGYPPLDESIFKGIRFKNPPLPQLDMNSGLLAHR